VKDLSNPLSLMYLSHHFDFFYLFEMDIHLPPNLSIIAPKLMTIKYKNHQKRRTKVQKKKL